MSKILMGKTMRAAIAVAVLAMVGATHAAAGQEPQVSEADLAVRLGQATWVTLVQSTALREQPRRDVRPDLSVPAGVQVRLYRRIYNRDGHWSFIRVDDVLGWVPSTAIE